MKIQKDSVASIAYSVKDSQGNLVEERGADNPLMYLHGGYDAILPKLEAALGGKKKGDKVDITVKAKDAYGEYNTDAIKEIPRQNFAAVENIEADMLIDMQSGEEVFTVKVLKVADDIVTVDGNHPLAGKDLAFNITVTDVRKATTEELGQ